MDYLIAFKEEITFATLFITLVVAFVKGFLVSQFKKFWKHLKKKKEVYNRTLGAVIMFFVFYSIMTVKKQVDIVQKKFNKYDTLKNVVTSGRSVYDYESFIESAEKIAVNNFLVLKQNNTEINFPSEEKWKNDTHLTNVFGIIFVDRVEKRVYFQYKSIVGKNKMSNKVFYTADYIKDNPKLFLNNLALQGNDREAFFDNSIKNCLNKPLKKDILKIEKDFRKGHHKYNTCDFRQSFFYVTGRIEGVEQKTFNQINYIYYIIVPFSKKDDSYLYFFYSFNSNSPSFLSYQVHSMLETFKTTVINYKQKIKDYEKKYKNKEI